MPPTVLRKQNYLEQRLNVGEDKRLKLIKTWQANTVFYMLIDFVRYQRVKLMSTLQNPQGDKTLKITS